jgi:hypothetical protein
MLVKNNDSSIGSFIELISITNGLSLVILGTIIKARAKMKNGNKAYIIFFRTSYSIRALKGSLLLKYLFVEERL